MCGAGPPSIVKLDAALRLGLVSQVAPRAGLDAALAATRPDAVCISTYTETHVDYAVAAMEAVQLPQGLRDRLYAGR